MPLLLGAFIFPPLLIPATLITAVRKGGVYWVLFAVIAGFFLSLAACFSLAVLLVLLR